MWIEEDSPSAVFVTGAVLAGRTTTAQRLGELVEPSFDVRVLPVIHAIKSCGQRRNEKKLSFQSS